MKKLLLLLGLFAHLHMMAGITFKDPVSANKKQKKEIAKAGKRVTAFYNWYLNYLAVNQTKPTSHIVLDQYTTPHMRNQALQFHAKYDAFLASPSFDPNCDLLITVQKLEAGRLSLYAEVSGKNNYPFYIDMVIQKGVWCIDLVTDAEDLDPAVDESGN